MESSSNTASRQYPNRNRSIAIVTIHYILGAFLGWLAYRTAFPSMNNHWALFLGDVAATIYIWALGLIYKNVSFYDPYWSVAPPVILTAWAVHEGNFSGTAMLLLFAVWLWGVRLTWNWAKTFKGLAFEDWRYSKFRVECNPFTFQVINFFGLNMVPTVVVFLAMLPAIDLLENDTLTDFWTYSGALVCIGAVVLQFLSDRQAHKFRAEHPGEVCNVGLWKHGRHPNYLGEIMMWWGIWLMAFSASFRYCVSGPCFWYLAGPLAVTVLFLTVSVPMMEKRQLANKPGYEDYKKNTRMFI